MGFGILKAPGNPSARSASSRACCVPAYNAGLNYSLAWGLFEIGVGDPKQGLLGILRRGLLLLRLAAFLQRDYYLVYKWEFLKKGSSEFFGEVCCCSGLLSSCGVNSSNWFGILNRKAPRNPGAGSASSSWAAVGRPALGVIRGQG